MMNTRKPPTTLLLCLAAAVVLLSASPMFATGEKTSPEERLAKYRQRVARLFIKEKSSLPDALTLPSGLVVQRIHNGAGTRAPAVKDECEVHYTGRLRDGTVFDSSRERGQTATFSPSQVIKGWEEALQLMREGDRWRVYIPFELGYGEAGAPPTIPPFSALEFDLELIRVKGGATGLTAAEVDEILRQAKEDRGDM